MDSWQPDDEDVRKFVEGFRRILDSEDSYTVVRECLDPESETRAERAGLTYSQLEPVTENTLELSDWLAVTLLDVDTPARAFRGIQHDEERRREIEGGLTYLEDVPLVDAADETLDRADEIYRLIRYDDPAAKTTWGMGPARTSKLLARKRPELVPIVDRRIKRWFGRPRYVWAPMRAALRSRTETGERYFDALDRHLRRDPLTRSLTVLRAMDVAAWELAGVGGSNPHDG